MNKNYIIGVLAGFLLVIFAMPLGDLYGQANITIGNGMPTEQYTMLMERAIGSFQIVGGITSTLSGLALNFSDKKQESEK